mmetsp:Transcript_6251/g.10013  ORF Transcript_6251/g.10013 Transcript_6251/m.10013 type:complete len:89 (+) Transcript_6251:687-953(+)
MAQRKRPQTVLSRRLRKKPQNTRGNLVRLMSSEDLHWRKHGRLILIHNRLQMMMPRFHQGKANDGGAFFSSDCLTLQGAKLSILGRVR